jgi:hypothetical protein
MREESLKSIIHLFVVHPVDGDFGLRDELVVANRAVKEELLYKKGIINQKYTWKSYNGNKCKQKLEVRSPRPLLHYLFKGRVKLRWAK